MVMIPHERGVGTDLSGAIMWVGLGLYMMELHDFSSSVPAN